MEEESFFSRKILPVIAIIALIATLVFLSLWLDVRAERGELRSQVAQATIVGHAYIDEGAIIGTLDDFDRPAQGLEVELYQIQSWESVMIQKTTVDLKGQYRFTIREPGMYYVLPVPAISGYPGWNWITHLRSSGNILVEEGGLYSGPIFLARDNGGRG